MSSTSPPRDAVRFIGRKTARNKLSARAQLALQEFAEARGALRRPDHIAAVNLSNTKVDTSFRHAEPSSIDNNRRYKALLAAMPHEAIQRVVIDTVDGYGLVAAGQRLRRAPWMPPAHNEDYNGVMAKVLLGIGADLLADSLDLSEMP